LPLDLTGGLFLVLRKAASSSFDCAALATIFFSAK
jgi:hypothetical protein